MGKLLLVAAPLVLYALAYGVRAAFGRRPSTHALNVELALLLVIYFLTTAGLGIFWVANQQLPPFDFHYLFGYATFVLVIAHLVMNARIIFAYFRRGPRAAKQRLGWSVLARATMALAIAAGAFFLGMRAGSPRLPTRFSGSGDASLEALEQYHQISTHSRRGVLLHAPSVAWELPVARYIDRGDRPRIALDPPEPSRLPERSLSEALAAWPRASERRFDRQDLATLLWATAGITERRGGHDLRASASSGALFPTEIYVLAYNVDGLAPAVYGYSPEEHALADLGRPVRADARMGMPAHEPERTPLAIVVTSVLRRTGQKYRDRAYRYAVADAGHAVGNAIVAAAELGMATEVVAAFEDGFVAEVVGVDDETEAVIALLSLQRGGEPGQAPAPAGFASRPIPEVDELELGATGLAHAATSLTWIGPRFDLAAERVALPSLPAPSVRALELIARRRSVRTFEASSLKLEDVSRVLGAALGVRPVVSRAVRAHVVASRIEHVAPGSLRHDSTSGALVRSTSGEVGARAGRAALDQDVVGNAPMAVVLSIDRRALLAEGARGYRNAFLEAGIIGARLYLASAAQGLGGCSVGAFYDEQTAELLGSPLSDEWPIHFFALGEPD